RETKPQVPGGREFELKLAKAVANRSGDDAFLPHQPDGHGDVRRRAVPGRELPDERDRSGRALPLELQVEIIAASFVQGVAGEPGLGADSYRKRLAQTVVHQPREQARQTLRFWTEEGIDCPRIPDCVVRRLGLAARDGGDTVER